MTSPGGAPGAATAIPFAYLDRWTARPGEGILLHVSSESAFEVRALRIVQADAGAHGPGRKEEEQDWYAPSAHEAVVQTVRPGSWAVSGPLARLAGATRVVLEVIFRPSLLDSHEDRLVAGLAARDGQCALAIGLGPGGRPELLVGTGQAGSGQAGTGQAGTGQALHEARTAASEPLSAGRWYRARAVLDLEEATASLAVTSAEPAPSGAYRAELGHELSCADLAYLHGTGAPHHLVLAAWEGTGSRTRPFNGKLEAPVVSAGPGAADGGRPFVYAWPLGRGAGTSELYDTSSEGASLRLVNAPTAGVTGHNWDGTVMDFTRAPEQYDALAFHDDDLEDAGWTPVAEIQLPTTLRSGVYALVVTNAAGPRYVPFFVVPGAGRPRARIAVLFSTFTYLAYANEHVREEVQEFAHVRTAPSPQDLEMAAHREFGLSLYDHHRDGTGVCYSSVLRPVVNFDPTYRFWLFDGPVHLGEDIYLLDWLERLGYEYDVLTDHQVHAEGRQALEGYRVVITGSHPEYVSGALLDALEDHVHGGGRLMYLGGNGHYWVTAVDPRRPHMIEIRRANSGGRTWESAPGETYLSSTGEPGGLWRHRGRPPNRLLGVGFSAQGADERAPGYRKVLTEEHEAQWGFVFAGVDDPEAIGELGLLLGGAAGNEVDRADHTRGTPVGTIVLATSKGHSDEYQLAVEDILLGAPGQGGTEQPLVRADMVVVPYASGGTVFSVGAITWLGALAYNNYDNDVAVVTGNVLRHFLSEPPPG